MNFLLQLHVHFPRNYKHKSNLIVRLAPVACSFFSLQRDRSSFKCRGAGAAGILSQHQNFDLPPL